jgi:hypothetical protein
MSVRNDDSITVTCILLYISHYFVMKVFFFFFTVRSCWRWMHLIVFYRFVYIWAAKNCCMAGYLQPLIYSKRLNVELLINADLNKGFLFNLHFSLLCTLPQVFFFKISKNLFKYGKTNNYVFLSCRFSGTPCTFDFSLRKPHFSVIHLLLSFPLLGENNGSFL